MISYFNKYNQHAVENYSKNQSPVDWPIQLGFITF